MQLLMLFRSIVLLGGLMLYHYLRLLVEQKALHQEQDIRFILLHQLNHLLYHLELKRQNIF